MLGWMNTKEGEMGGERVGMLHSRVDRCCTISGLCAHFSVSSSSSSSSSPSNEIPFLESKRSEWRSADRRAALGGGGPGQDGGLTMLC